MKAELVEKELIPGEYYVVITPKFNLLGALSKTGPVEYMVRAITGAVKFSTREIKEIKSAGHHNVKEIHLFK